MEIVSFFVYSSMAFSQATSDGKRFLTSGGSGGSEGASFWAFGSAVILNIFAFGSGTH